MSKKHILILILKAIKFNDKNKISIENSYFSFKQFNLISYRNELIMLNIFTKELK